MTSTSLVVVNEEQEARNNLAQRVAPATQTSMKLARRTWRCWRQIRCDRPRSVRVPKRTVIVGKVMGYSTDRLTMLVGIAR